MYFFLYLCIRLVRYFVSSLFRSLFSSSVIYAVRFVCYWCLFFLYVCMLSRYFFVRSVFV